ncbi:hypothetical protein [Pseudoalteromonas spongiae]|uniref:hypothetical protein n=1 Tax=Pseudoalteromonas spongiae TaxID=298657 RepID=UPI000C2D2422|nr:hypothetical protein [Pseudoalteromonas spongiae]
MSLDLMLISLFGSLATYLLAKRNRFDGIRASTSLSIIAYLFFFTVQWDVALYSLVFFGSTFVGMSAPKRFGIYTQVIAAVLFSVLFENLVPFIKDYGGALGLSAFFSVCVCHLGILLGAPRSIKVDK